MTPACLTRPTPATPLQLAAAGVPFREAVLALVMARGLRPAVAKRAIREAYDALRVPTAGRLRAGLTRAACDQVGARLRTVTVGGALATCPVTAKDARVTSQCVSRHLTKHRYGLSEQAIHEIAESGAIRETYVCEYPEPLAA